MATLSRVNGVSARSLMGLSLALGSSVAAAGTLAGSVVGADGRPVAAAMGTLSDAHRGIAESVFPDPAGNFALRTQLSGTLELRIRKPYLRDAHEAVTVPETTTARVRVTMQNMSSAAEI